MIPTEDEINAPFKALLKSLSETVKEDGRGLMGDLLALLGILSLIGSVCLLVVGSGI